MHLVLQSFFFQAEDGIRDLYVTGVQTCALPISHTFRFGRALNFTLPSESEGVSIEADMERSTIIFPLGPALHLSWADCNARVNPDRSKVYRCELKPGYRFQ